MIKIFTDSNFLKEEYRRMIFPLLFDLHYAKNKQLFNYYQFVAALEDADVVIVPVDIAYFFKNKKTKLLYNFIDEAMQLKKKIWVYSAGDIGNTLNKNVYTFRLGGFESKLNSNTLIIPAHTQNPYETLNREFKPLAKKENPSIGFVGHANGSLINYFKEYLIYGSQNLKRLLKIDFNDYQSFYPSGFKRYQYLHLLQKNQHILTDFIFRRKYRAGAKTEEERHKTTIDFFENINTNPYTFCMRGGGNFSVRFYETLAMGRIPLLIDTDCRLPLNKNIQWEKHCVIASEKDFVEKLIHFHKNISEKDFEQKQINNRNLWLNYLTRENYFVQIHEIFKEGIK